MSRADEAATEKTMRQVIVRSEGVLVGAETSTTGGFGRSCRNISAQPLVSMAGYTIGDMTHGGVILAPIPIVRKLFEKTSLSRHDMDFSTQVETYPATSIVLSRKLNIEPKDSL